MKNAFGLGALIAVLSLTQSYVSPEESKQVKKERPEMSREWQNDKHAPHREKDIEDAVE